MLDLLSIGAILYFAIVLVAIAICRAAATDDAPPVPGPRIGPLLRL